MTRGYAAIGLVNTKIEHNVGGVLRAAHCFNAALIVMQGARFKKQSADTTKAERHIPLIEAPILDSIPYNCIPVAIELVDNSRSLFDFTHPERAMYIFGPEDGSVPLEIQKKCKHIVSIPTKFCLNLAATVNVVLYDRAIKTR